MLQTAEVATAYGTDRAFALRAKLQVDSGAVVTLPSRLLLTDPDSSTTDYTSLNVSGTVLGLTELVVAEGGRAVFALSSRNGVDLSQLGPAASLMLARLSVTHGGRVSLGLDDSLSEFTLTILQNLDVEYGGVLESRVVSITTPTASLAFGGEITTSGLGQPAIQGSNPTGGSHGGRGGMSANTTTLPDSVFDVTASGEGGSSVTGNAASSGGSGGGFITIAIDNTFTLHGVVSCNGSKGTGSAGGGAGGGVVLSTNHLLGGGQIQAAGGDGGNVAGGGGGGGRIKTFIRADNNFTGTYIVRGGSSKTQAGGAGTALEEEFWTGDKTLYVSNTGASGATFAQTPLHLTHNTTTTFTLLSLGQNVNLYLPPAPVTLVASEMACGSGTVVTVEDGVVMSADVDKTETRLACSFILRPQGELRLPNVVELLGAGNKFDGRFVMFLRMLCLCWP